MARAVVLMPLVHSLSLQAPTAPVAPPTVSLSPAPQQATSVLPVLSRVSLALALGTGPVLVVVVVLPPAVLHQSKQQSSPAPAAPPPAHNQANQPPTSVPLDRLQVSQAVVLGVGLVMALEEVAMPAVPPYKPFPSVVQ